jgi:hypothetical protein
VQLSPSSALLRAEPGWLWSKLERRITLSHGPTPESCRVNVKISWDAGTAAYEPFLAIRIAHHCRERLTSLSHDFAQLLTSRSKATATEGREQLPTGMQLSG